MERCFVARLVTETMNPFRLLSKPARLRCEPPTPGSSYRTKRIRGSRVGAYFRLAGSTSRLVRVALRLFVTRFRMQLGSPRMPDGRSFEISDCLLSSMLFDCVG
jgi:hypothetical protein